MHQWQLLLWYKIINLPIDEEVKSLLYAIGFFNI